MNECYISVDIETTGPIPGKNAMIELGAVVLADQPKHFFAKLHIARDADVDQHAISAIGLTPKALNERYFHANDLEDPREAIARFAEWVEGVAAEHGRPVFLANNAPFDWMFISWYFNRWKTRNPFGHSALDMKAYFMGLIGCSWDKAVLSEMAAYAGMTFTALPHHALQDAIIQGEIFKRLLLQKEMHEKP